jgi:ADP-heptose:LPS heptosyltransferase
LKKVLLLAHHALGDLIMKAPMINYIKSHKDTYDLHITVRDETLRQFANKYLDLPLKNIYLLNMNDSFIKKSKLILKLLINRYYINKKLSKILSLALLPKHTLIMKKTGDHKVIENFKVAESPHFNRSENYKSFYHLKNIPKSNIKNKIIIHPGSGEKESFKQYPLNRWSLLIKLIRDSHPDYDIILTGHGDSENKICNQLKQDNPSITNLSGKLALNSLIEEISSSVLFISADCGPSHLASILKVKQVTLFGPTNPKYTGALNTNQYTLTPLNKCSPCYNTIKYGTIGCSNNTCMTEIDPNLIFKEILLNSQKL